MALRFKGSEEPDENSEQQPKRHGPILHTPKAGNPFVKLIIPVGVIILLAVAGYFYYKYRSQSQSAPPAVVTLPQQDSAQMAQQAVPADSSAMMSEAPPQQPVESRQEAKQEPRAEKKAVKQPEKTVAKAAPKREKPAASTVAAKSTPKKESAPPRETYQAPKPDFKTSSGNFVIYVGSFKNKASAETVEGRWREAGYPTHLSRSGGWYRVSIGNYPSKEEGKRVAEKMRDAFEYGYWVDVLQ